MVFSKEDKVVIKGLRRNLNG